VRRRHRRRQARRRSEQGLCHFRVRFEGFQRVAAPFPSRSPREHPRPSEARASMPVSAQPWVERIDGRLASSRIAKAVGDDKPTRAKRLPRSTAGAPVFARWSTVTAGRLSDLSRLPAWHIPLRDKLAEVRSPGAPRRSTRHGSDGMCRKRYRAVLDRAKAAGAGRSPRSRQSSGRWTATCG
jgi:hypothetical protein